MIVSSSFDGHNSISNNVNGWLYEWRCSRRRRHFHLALSFYLLFVVVAVVADDHLSIFAYQVFFLL